MGEFDVDYESKVAGLKNSAETHALENPRAVGRNSLLINNTEPSTVYIGFPDTYGIDLHNKKGFILNLYLKPPMHKTLFRTMMVNKEASKIPSAYINPYLSLSDSTYFSKLSSEKWDWEIVVLLSSIGSGKPRIKEIIETAEKKTMVDGLQSYIIESIN